MRRDAILINCARGGIVNESALLEALRCGTIAAAASDVLSQEPPPIDHPMLTAQLSNLIITPHSAWLSQEARQRILNHLARQLQAAKQGASPIDRIC